MKSVKEICIEGFEKNFVEKPDFYSYAPGRVNLIGEHTDYNGGFVLPCAIQFGTCMVARLNGTDKIRCLALDMENDFDEFEISRNIVKNDQKLWANYLRGVVYQFCERFEGKIRGLDIAIKGNVPKGSGLSSSASLEVCLGTLLKGIFNLEISPMDIALIGQKAEAYIGMKCGIMDQAISANGTADHAVRIDCKSYELTSVKVPEDALILIINSNVKHQLVGSEYNDRRESCEKAARVIGVPLLRDATMEMLEKVKPQLDDETFRRAKHVISENERVLLASEAFEKGDLKTLSKLMYESHVSMRDDFEIVVTQTDTIVNLVKEALNADYAPARQTGGGFGGCVVAVVNSEDAKIVGQTVMARYHELTGLNAEIFVTKACAGAHFEKV
jgi:galactokinase